MKCCRKTSNKKVDRSVMEFDVTVVTQSNMTASREIKENPTTNCSSETKRYPREKTNK